MLISDSHKFIFIHISKTAGTSIEHTISPYALKKPHKAYSLIRPLGLPKDYRKFRFRKHAYLDEVQSKLPADVYEMYLKFAVVRNPWDRFISGYHGYYGIKPNGRTNRTPMALIDYLKAQCDRGNRQLVRINNIQGELGTNVLLRFENLTVDFKNLAEKLKLDVCLPHKNASTRNKNSYQDYYDKQTQNYVQEHWASEIEQLGYTFD